MSPPLQWTWYHGAFHGAKPHGGVDGHMTANACTGKEGLDGVGVFDREAGGFTGIVQGS